MEKNFELYVNTDTQDALVKLNGKDYRQLILNRRYRQHKTQEFIPLNDGEHELVIYWDLLPNHIATVYCYSNPDQTTWDIHSADEEIELTF